MCATLESVPNITSYCIDSNRWRTEKLGNKTLARSVELEIYNYARENLAIINMFIKESYTKRFRKTEKMSRISYIASSGGLLGLCMGFSFVSLAEIAYHCFLCLGMLFRHNSARLLRKDLWKQQSAAAAAANRKSPPPGGRKRSYLHCEQSTTATTSNNFPVHHTLL